MSEDLDYAPEYADPIAARLEAITSAALEVDGIANDEARKIVLDAMASAAASIRPKTKPASVTAIGKVKP